MAAHTDISIRTGTHRSRHRCTNRQPPRHMQMCILAPTNTQAHMHMANSQVHAGTCPCVHAHTRPLGSHSLHTVSGRFLSLSSLRSKHWLIMGLSELHMVCEGRVGGQGGSTGKGRGDFWGKDHLGPNLEPSPQSSSPPSGSGREGHCFYPEILGGESRCEVRKSPFPCPLRRPSPRIFTCHTVGHFSSIVQKAELSPAQRFPGPLVSQLVPGGDRERKLQLHDSGCYMTAQWLSAVHYILRMKSAPQEIT